MFDSLRKKAGSIVICVSPLTSLMLDQQQEFSRYALATEFVGEAQEDPNAIARVTRKAEFSFCTFNSPDSLLTTMLRSEVYRENLVAFVVDEAHCVKQW